MVIVHNSLDGKYEKKRNENLKTSKKRNRYKTNVENNVTPRNSTPSKIIIVIVITHNNLNGEDQKTEDQNDENKDSKTLSKELKNPRKSKKKLMLGASLSTSSCRSS